MINTSLYQKKEKKTNLLDWRAVCKIIWMIFLSTFAFIYICLLYASTNHLIGHTLRLCTHLTTIIQMVGVAYWEHPV